MTYEIKRFDLLTVFKVSFLVYLVVGFLIGLLYGLILVKMISTFGPLMENGLFENFGEVGFMAAITMALFMAIFIAVVWSVITVIAAGIYNVICGWIGGLRLELEAAPDVYSQTAVSPPTAPPPQQGGTPGA